MILCNKECLPCCGFCAYQMGSGRGTNRGYCISKGEYVDWAGDCNDDYHCFNALVEPEVPNLLQFFAHSYKVFTLKDETYPTPDRIPFMERFTAWRNMADYTFEGKRRGKAK